MKNAAKNILQIIGNTPLLELNLSSEFSGRMFAKAEFLNPGASIKDRVALKVIETAKREGRLKDKQTVVEMTSGNMGSGLAIVCAALGHPFVAVMSEGNSVSRRRMLEALGAEVVLVPQVDGVPENVTGADVRKADEVARKVASQRAAYYVSQFHNPNCVLAHYESTGPEMFQQMNGNIGAFVSCVGSAGTFVGIAKYLKEMNSNILCIAVEPAGCEVLSGKSITKPRHTIQGTSYGVVPPHWKKDLCDGYLAVDDHEIQDMQKRLGSHCGVFVGYSAAANVCGALQVLRKYGVENTVTLLNDSAFKYA